MRRLAGLLTAAVLLLGLSACGQTGGEEDAFTVDIVCESEGLVQIFYSCYIGGEYRGMGGIADLDGAVIERGRVFSLVFSRNFFEEGDDPAQFSLTLSPYGEGDTQEIATTQPVEVPAQYGGHYTLVFSGDREGGFAAGLREE